MCGIVGYLGKKNALEPVISGLKALEYRGYDSAGVAFISKNGSEVIKQTGRVEQLEKSTIYNKDVLSINPKVAIGHTRWATHGAPTIVNAHPHFNSDKTIFVVHNGIVENSSLLRAKLEQLGYVFVSQTDTEVIPHLIDHYYKKLGNFEKAFEQTLRELSGAYAITAISTYEPDKIFAARLSSPLILGVGEGEFILASDPTAVMEYTKDVVYLKDYDVVTVSRDGYKVKNLKKAVIVKRRAETLDFDFKQAKLGDYPDFMLKEIYEAPATIRLATLGRIQPQNSIVMLGGLESVRQQLKYIDRIVIVACGTSYYAGLVGEYLIEELANIPVEVQLASEFKYRNEPFSRRYRCASRFAVW